MATLHGSDSHKVVHATELRGVLAMDTTRMQLWTQGACTLPCPDRASIAVTATIGTSNTINAVALPGRSVQ